MHEIIALNLDLNILSLYLGIGALVSVLVSSGISEARPNTLYLKSLWVYVLVTVVLLWPLALALLAVLSFAPSPKSTNDNRTPTRHKNRR